MMHGPMNVKFTQSVFKTLKIRGKLLMNRIMVKLTVRVTVRHFDYMLFRSQYVPRIPSFLEPARGG
jgi:hypothetical protein